ncbi:MAG: fold metallo-hydrolase [Chthonomonadaceae bacterium]|nr:fold metallo-hydrolase [Chthonomonadaceae bacterium]
MRVYRIDDGIWQISLAWSNAWVLWEGGGGEATLIDTGLQEDRDALRVGLQQIGIDAAQVSAVLLTHAHCDHAGNAAYFAGRSATVKLHENEAPFLGLPRRTYIPPGPACLLRPHTALAFAIGEARYPVERVAQGLVTLISEETIEAPGGPLRVVASPGHTPGHIAFYRESDGVLFSGDAAMNIIPIKRVVGLSLPIRFLSSDWEQGKASARRLADLRPRLLLSGHGPPLREDTPERLQAWAQAL